MDPIKHINRQSLEAGLLWSVILHMARQTILTILALPEGHARQQIVSGALFFVAFLAYPMLLNGIMQAKTLCWRNPMIHATAGSALGLMGILLISTLGAGLWLESGIIALGIWSLLEVMLPWIRESKFLKQERNKNKKQWQQLSQLSLTRMMLLQVPSLKE